MEKLFKIQQEGQYGKLQCENTIEDIQLFDPGSVKEVIGLVIPKRRFRIIAIIVVFFFLLLAGRAFYLQGIQGSSYGEIAEGNRVRKELIIPPRGLIFDTNGIILAQNVPTFVLTMTLADLPEDDSERHNVLMRAADLSGLQRTEIDLLITQYSSSPYDPIPIKKGISYEPAIRLAIESESLPGFSLDISSTRFYATSATSLSHVLGYTGKLTTQDFENVPEGEYRRTDEIGKAGIEKSAEQILRGKAGRLVAEVNARGKELSVIAKENPVNGGNIILTIDSQLQTFIENRLNATLSAVSATRGSVIALDPQTGGMLAMVSLPSFDSNSFARGISEEEYLTLTQDTDNPMFPRAISGDFPSGSTFKPFVAYGALEEGLINEHTTFLSTGGLSIGPWFFPDWKAGGHGYTDIRKAIAESVNTFFYIIGGGYESLPGLGVQRITEYAQKFGFGKKTGIDLPGESEGFLPSKQWKEDKKNERWYVGDTYHYAIGQGDILVTPLQMAAATAVIANGGELVHPHVIKAVDGGSASIDLKPDTDNDLVFNSQNIQIVREGMRQAVTRGSAKFLQWLPENVAGKTGTAQTIGDKPTHAWFTGFGPYQNTDITLTILIEEGGDGAQVAVPLANEIFYWWFTSR